MKNFFTLCLVAVGAASLLMSPNTSFAYKTTGQTAALYSSTTALYTITYRFGFLNREAYLPIATTRDLAFGSSSDNLGYQLVARTGSSTTAGMMAGLVLSNATIKNGMYYLPAGKAADFTLVAALTLPSNQSAADYALLVSALPFYMIDDGKTVRAQLNPSELQYYITPRAKVTAKAVTNNHNIQVSGITYTLSSTNGVK